MPRKKQVVADEPKAAEGSFDKEIKQLVDKGEKEGHLDQKDVFALIPDTPANIDILDQLYTDLAEVDIEVIVPTEPAELSDEWVVEEEEDPLHPIIKEITRRDKKMEANRFICYYLMKK